MNVPAMNVPLLLDIGRARIRLVTGLLVGLAALTVMYLAMFPAIKDQLDLFAAELPDAMKALIGDADLSTLEGYLRSEVFALTAPILVAALAITTAVALTRAERDLTLTPFFNAPISRLRLASTHLASSLLVAVTGGAVVVVAILAGTPLAGSGVEVARVLAATAHLTVFAAAMGAVAFGVAAATGSPAAGLGAGWGLMLVSFVANSVAELVAGAGWLADVSPWSWYGGGAALTHGLDAGGIGLLVALGGAAAATGLLVFRRRDLGL